MPFCPVVGYSCTSVTYYLYIILSVYCKKYSQYVDNHIDWKKEIKQKKNMKGFICLMYYIEVWFIEKKSMHVQF